MSVIHSILEAKRTLENNGLTAKYVRLSPVVHEQLVVELNKRDGNKSKYKRIFEIFGMKVEIEEECPQGGAYVSGEDPPSPGAEP
jgi:hypothetical protein